MLKNGKLYEIPKKGERFAIYKSNVLVLSGYTSDLSL